MGGLPLGRDAARAALGDDAYEDDHALPGLDEALGLEPPLRPGVPEPSDQLAHPATADVHLLALGVVGRHQDLELLVVVLVEQVIEQDTLALRSHRQGKRPPVRVDTAHNVDVLVLTSPTQDPGR